MKTSPSCGSENVLTPRDYFAGIALHVILNQQISLSRHDMMFGKGGLSPAEMTSVAKLAYKIADGMLSESSEKD